MNEQLVSKQIQFAIKNNVKVELNDRQVHVESLLKLSITLFSVFLLLTLFAISAFFEITFTETITTKSLMVSGVIFSFALSVLVIGFYYWFTFIKPNVKFVPEQVDKVEKVVTAKPVDMVEDVVEKVEIRDITKGFNNPFLKKGVNGEVVLVSERETKLYTFDDLLFNFQTDAGFWLTGSSGSGKSILAYNLIEQINKQTSHNIKYVISDFGESDFTESLPTDITSFKYTLQLMNTIMKGRQKDKDKNAVRIFWLIEEAESLFDMLNANLKKKDYDATITYMANVVRMSRKWNMSVCLVTQAGKAASIDTKISSSLSNRFIMSCPQNISGRVFNLPYKLDNLPSGFAYYNQIDAFVQTELIPEPEMNALTLKELESLASFYKRKFNFGDEGFDEEKDEN